MNRDKIYIIEELKLKNFCTKQNLYEFIDNLKNILKINYFDNSYKIADKLIQTNLIEIHNEDFACNHFSGMLIKNKGSKSHIIINKNLNKEDKNFALAHELIHYLCHDVNNLFMCRPFSAKINDSREWQANEGAAELLLPYRYFIPDFLIGLELFKGNEESLIKDMAETFSLSPMVINYRINNLQYEIEQYKKGVSIENIKVISRNQLNKKSKINY